MKKFQPINEHEIAALVRDGDDHAFRLMFDHYSNKLFTYSFNFLKSREAAEEIVQEVFLNVWINRERLDPDYALAPLLYTLTRRYTLNALRAIARSKAGIENFWNQITDTANLTEDQVLAQDLERFTEKVLLSLPKQQQQVFRMSRQQELSYDEIADSLNISRNTVRNHLVAALKTLRLHVSRTFFSVASFLAAFFM